MKLRRLTVLATIFALAVSYGHAQQTAQEKYDALAAKGIFAGIDSSAGLDQNMNRAQFARVAALILGLEGIGSTDIKEVTARPFSDIELGTWYTQEITAAHFGQVSVTPESVGSVIENQNGTSTLSAVVGTIKYVAPDGTTTTIDMGNGAIINANGAVDQVTTLQALIALESQNGTANNPNSLTAGLKTVVAQISARVSAGEFGEAGPAIIAAVVGTASKANPAAAASYAKTSIETVAASDKLSDTEKKSAATLVTNKAVAAVPASERTALTGEIGQTLVANSENLGMTANDVRNVTNTAGTATDNAPAPGPLPTAPVDLTVVAPVSPT